MKQQIINFKLPNGGEINILGLATEIEKQDGFTLSSSTSDKLIEYASASFEKSIEQIQLFSQLLIDSLKSVNPNEIKAEFGLLFSADAGVIISLGTQFNVKVEFTWKNEVNSKTTTNSKETTNDIR